MEHFVLSAREKGTKEIIFWFRERRQRTKKSDSPFSQKIIRFAFLRSQGLLRPTKKLWSAFICCGGSPWRLSTLRLQRAERKRVERSGSEVDFLISFSFNFLSSSIYGLRGWWKLKWRKKLLAGHSFFFHFFWPICRNSQPSVMGQRNVKEKRECRNGQLQVPFVRSTLFPGSWPTIHLFSVVGHVIPGNRKELGQRFHFLFSLFYKWPTCTKKKR